VEDASVDMNEQWMQMEGQLVQLADGTQLQFAQDVPLPEPLASIREFSSTQDNDLRGEVSNITVANDTLLTAAVTFDPVHFVSLNAIAEAAFAFAQTAVTIAIGLIGILALWLGLMQIADKAGMIHLLVRAIQPVLRPLFPEIPKGHTAMGMIILNMSANVLGLGNAATPMGIKAMEELQSQVAAVGRGEPVPNPEQYPRQIAMNVLPHVDDFVADEDHYTKEELKMRNETRKILHEEQLAFAATCVRVPTMVGHAESVHVEFGAEAPMAELREALRVQPGVEFLADPAQYVTPLQAEGDDRTFVSRLRRDPTVEHGVVFWCVTDNLRKGAATNAIQIAEELIRRGKLKRS
jgi:hypothetical protein